MCEKATSWEKRTPHPLPLHAIIAHPLVESSKTPWKTWVPCSYDTSKRSTWASSTVTTSFWPLQISVLGACSSTIFFVISGHLRQVGEGGRLASLRSLPQNFASRAQGKTRSISIYFSPGWQNSASFVHKVNHFHPKMIQGYSHNQTSPHIPIYSLQTQTIKHSLKKLPKLRAVQRGCAHAQIPISLILLCFFNC